MGPSARQAGVRNSAGVAVDAVDPFPSLPDPIEP
jgi:hypothetical protein